MPSYKKPLCPICKKGEGSFFFSLQNPYTQKTYPIYRCSFCSSSFLFPPPSKEEISSLYEENYFLQRTSRGYDQYMKEETKKIIQDTLRKNLQDIGFSSLLKELPSQVRILEVGCAGGHFLEILQKEYAISLIEGIDISSYITQEAREKRFSVITGDFLSYRFSRKYHIIFLWAVIEHFIDIEEAFRKIFSLLYPGGWVVFSTCHYGFFAKLWGKKWRYFNVPEHIYYFSQKGLTLLLKRFSFDRIFYFTYGSGFTTKKNPPLGYNWLKKGADFLAKYFPWGDMIVFRARRST